MKNLNQKFILCAVGLGLLAGCGNAATIQRTSGSLSAKIVGGDAQNIYVEKNDGFAQAIPRSDILDIDHPGNVAATIGGVVSVYGIANIAIGAPECDKGGPAYCVGVFLPATLGVSLVTYGLSTYVGSTSAMDKAPENGVLGSIVVAPTHEFAGLPKTPGVTVGGSF